MTSQRPKRTRLQRHGVFSDSFGEPAPVSSEQPGQDEQSDQVGEASRRGTLTAVPAESEPTAVVAEDEQERVEPTQDPSADEGIGDKSGDTFIDKPSDKSADKPTAPSTPATTGDRDTSEMKDPTGIELPPNLHAKVQKAAKRDGVRQTDVVLEAFEDAYPRLDDLVAEYRGQHQVESPLFGHRSVHRAKAPGVMQRLQIRPTVREHQMLRNLADHYNLSLAVLTRLVLTDYFGSASRKAG